ncbi:MAG: acyltransferase [Nitrospira sp.]|nr:acyltransferase [Nitrospira sp.]
MKYRPEIDGLRAIAVIPVILFHAGMPLFTGGFIGVDIFFVISGYLITTIILTELEAGKFSILHFYERRARRILPALFLVLGLCLPFAWLWLMPADLSEFTGSVLAVLCFSANIYFWRQSDYFDSATELKPLLHTWSLGVEEQFYVFFPIFLLLAWRMRRSGIVGLLVIGSLLSLALAQYGTGLKPVATFFLLPTRGWELAIGSLIAFHLTDTVRHKEKEHFPSALSQILSLAGLGLIIYSILVFHKETPFPSLYTLVPTAGAALLILFARPNTVVGRVLAGRFLVAVGLVSYSAYLWHQPLFSFARHRSLTDLNPVVIASLVALTFGLAYLTWRFVERPFRQKAVVSKRVLWGSAAGCALIIASFAVGLQVTVGEFQSNIHRESQAQFRAYTCMFEPDQTHQTLLENRCHQPPGPASQKAVESLSTSKRYVLYGDSLAAHLYPGLVSKIRESQIVQLTGGACRAIRSVDTPRCLDFYDWFVDEYIPNNAADRILVSSSWLSDYERLGDKTFREKLRDLFERLQGNRVLVYSMAASLKVDVHRYYHKLETFGHAVPSNLIMEGDDLTVVNSVLREEAARFGFEFVDIEEQFCSKSQCLVAKDGVLQFSDARHLTVAGSVLVAESTYRFIVGGSSGEPTS